MAKGIERVGDLNGQFPSGRQNESAHLAAPFHHLLQNRQAEGRCFSRARSRFSDNAFPLEQHWNSGCLNRCRFRKTLGGNGFKEPVIKLKMIKLGRFGFRHGSHQWLQGPGMWLVPGKCLLEDPGEN